METVRGYGNDEPDTQYSAEDDTQLADCGSPTVGHTSANEKNSAEHPIQDEVDDDTPAEITNNQLRDTVGENARPGFPTQNNGRVHNKRMEAELFRVFIEDLGPTLDPRDSVRTFALEIAEKAIQTPALRQAILVTAAKYVAATERSQGIFDEQFLNNWSRRLTTDGSGNYDDHCWMSTVALLQRVQHNIEGEAA